MSKRVHSNVEQLLKYGYKTASPQQLRDSDKALLLAVWDSQGLHLTPEQKAVFMQRCDIAESITRARRDLKTDYPASPKVDQARFDKFKQYRGEYAATHAFNQAVLGV